MSWLVRSLQFCHHSNMLLHFHLIIPGAPEKKFLDAIASLDSVLSVSWLVGQSVGWSHFLKSRVWRSNSRFIIFKSIQT